MHCLLTAEFINVNQYKKKPVNYNYTVFGIETSTKLSLEII